MFDSGSTAMISQENGNDPRQAGWRAFDVLPAAVCVVTPMGEIRYANPALHALLGHPVPSLVGTLLSELEVAAGTAAPSGSGRQLRRRDGRCLWVAETATPIEGPDGTPLQLSVFTEIDEWRRRELELHNRLLMREALFDTLPVPVFVKDVRGQYADVNSAFERYTGLDRRDILQRTAFALMEPGSAKVHAAHDRRLLAGEGEAHYEEPVPVADGSLRMASLSKVSFRDSAGNIGGIVGVIHDLIDSQPNEARLEAILEQSPIGVSVSRRDDGRIVFVNTRFAELIGLPRERLVGSRARDYYLDNHQRERVLERLRAAGAVVNMEVQFKKADGSPFWTLFTVNQAIIQGVEVNLAWIYDYTERRNMEEALRDMASRDPLTGIHNRRSFMELARQQLARAHRFHEPLAVFVLDVDHFKRINDSYGHATGDDALRMVAAGCQAILREYDLLGRLGGEEFVVVLPGATADETRVVAERVRRYLARMPIPGPDGRFHLTSSIGIAGLEGATDTLEKAIHRADLALYRAKHEGRNRVVVYEPGM
ncbi:sensor domain-containing diguanylate cyclase [Azospirillum agricola]|uniref:sensor domain-containing diguanylate cyclase n=1 Tax=Azospirillum agricola TaxID=1720247 RepID=UPI000A0F19E3|nr:diguanylate cyclase [Azospirillum agricola]SMH59839.1 PAS domain S-box-containing protein/diguanylate cyclase (GGDEF) domain-containing protein [Azospirillum lipoferum]